MYLLNELILLSPLIVYVCFRVRRLIARKHVRNIATGFFVLLLAGYPLAESLSHNAGSGWAKYPMIAGYCSLPFLLYLVLIVIVSDLALGILQQTTILRKETVRRPGFSAIRLLLLFLIPTVIVFAGVLNNNRLRVEEYSVEVPRRSSKLSQLKIAFASDFHLGQITNPRFMERFVEKLNDLNPDIVLIGGDVLEGDRQDESSNGFAMQFRRIRSKYGIYAAPGNHELHGVNGNEFFAKAGITLLQDSVVKIGGGFFLAGRIDSYSRDRKSIDDLLRNTPDDLPLILLDHRPINLDSVSNSPVDIQLSGHTHYGQLFPVNFISQREYELSWGYLKKRQTHFIVTSGVQVWGPPIRTAGISEIVSVKVLLQNRYQAAMTRP
jgi:uncharacterized protein